MVYARFFNATITLETALRLDATAIIKMFEGFASNPDRYLVQEEARGYMASAVSAIEVMYERYKMNKTKPDRHPGYIEDESSNLSTLQVAYQDNKFNLRTLFDIVAWILSVVGPVPIIATKENYYYPLMMIGYAFSAKLIPKQNVKRKRSPGPTKVWSVMWFKQITGNQQVMRVVVGATLDYPKDEAKDIAKDFRKDLLNASDILGWDPKTPSAMQELSPDGRSQDFGHCAETYPLLFICSLGQGQEATTIQRSAEGLAAEASLLYDEGTAKIVPYKEAEGMDNKLMNPCRNCEWLLGYGEGFQIAHFTPVERQI